MTSTDLRRLQEMEVALKGALNRIRQLEDELLVLRTQQKETDNGC